MVLLLFRSNQQHSICPLSVTQQRYQNEQKKPRDGKKCDHHLCTISKLHATAASLINSKITDGSELVDKGPVG